MAGTKRGIISRNKLRTWTFPYGFKAKAKRHSLDLRRSAGFDDHDRLDCHELARTLGIQVVLLSDLEQNEHTRHLTEIESSALSAATVRRNDKIGIWLNDSHPPERQASNLAHEIAHVILEHQDAPPLNDNGCREYDAGIEAEADYLGSVLLVTDNAALTVARSGTSLDEAAHRLGISPQLMQWRINDSGARTRVQRERLRRSYSHGSIKHD